MILTIAIPTYNRPDKIKSTIERLLPQLTENVKVLVLDNCSVINVKDHLQKEIGNEIADKITVIRHRVNIGADANFSRCFELCDTPYIWMIGDDDKIEEKAVQIIFDEIEQYRDRDIIGINFSSNLIKRTQPAFINNIKELGEKIDDFGNWSFISTSIYKTEEYQKQLQYAMWGTYAMSSQLIPTMKAISTGKVFILSEKYIVTHIPEMSWSQLQFALGLSSLLEAPVNYKQDEFRLFGEKLRRWYSIYPGDALYFILKSVNLNINLIDNYHIYIYKKLFWTSFQFRTDKLTHFIQYYQCLFLLKNKVILKLACKIFPKIRQRAEVKVPFYLFKR